MSHFPILVIGDNPKEALMPFKYGIAPEGCDKWDARELGGRWAGLFQLKSGKDKVDMALKKEIDFEAVYNEAAAAAARRYDLAMSMIGVYPPNRPWEEIRREVTNSLKWDGCIKEIDAAKRRYWAQPRCKAWSDPRVRKRAQKSAKEWPFSWEDSPDDFLISKDEYVQRARKSALTTHAVLKDGVWYEAGNMVSFGMIEDEKDADVWNREFNELLESTPDDTLLSLWDCHTS